MTTILLTLSLTGVLFLLLHQYRQSTILKEELASLKEVQEVLVTKAALESREEERKRFARDWHDNMGNVLSTARLLTDTIQTDTPQSLLAVQDLLEEAHIIAKSVFANTQVTAIHSQQELEKYLLSIKQQLQLAGISLDYTLSEAANFNQLAEKEKWHFSNILQELITNIIKHAAATTIHVQLQNNDKGISLLVSDNGKGAANKVPKTVGERVALLNGQLSIMPNQPQGTAVSIVIS